MRFFEMTAFILVLISLAGNGLKFVRSLKGIRYIPVLTAVVIIVHYFTEGIRWQMYPIYLLVVILLFRTFTGNKKIVNRHSKSNRLLSIAIVSLMIVSSAASCIILPVQKVLKPGGKYSVGTFSYFLNDPSRQEIYAEDTSDTRRIMIQFWYPTDSVKGLKRAPWLENGKIVSKGIARLMNMPDFLMSHLKLVKSNSYYGAVVSKAQKEFPVVIISHGWTGFRDIHVNFAEMLASNGYIVVAIDHTYGALATTFDDGRAVFLNKNALPSGLKKKEFSKYSSNLVGTYAGDIIFTIDSIGRFNSGEIPSILNGHMDLDNLGVMGHSTGGGAAVKASILDKRIKAIMGLDPWVEPLQSEFIDKGISVPGVFLRSQQWEGKPNNINLYNLMRNSDDNISLYSIKGTYHNDFTMAHIISPLTKYINMGGSLDADRSMEIQQNYVLEFFNKYLMKSSSNALSGLDEKYEEVRQVNIVK